MPFFNIFSKKEAKEKPQAEIIIDIREKNSLVIANLIERKAKIKFETLQIADYIVGETAIERKTFQDFISSMINKRLMFQLKEIKKYPKYFLIIENFKYEYPENMENAISGMFLSIATEYKIPIIFTKDEQDTAKFLILLAKKQNKPKTTISLRPPASNLTKEEQKQYILEGFPGIGPSTAQSLLREFNSIKNIINAPENPEQEHELKEILGKKYEIFKQLIN